MEYAGGRTVANRDDAGRLGPSARQRLGRELVDVLANLHALDVDAAGLGSLRRPGGLVQRQLLRWRSQLDGYPALTTSLLEELHAELDRQMPEPQRTSLVHGDFKLANLRVDEAGNVVAVLDWELAAIGDPLIDLGWLVASWVDATDNRPWITKPPTAVGGFAAPQELIAWYASTTGLDLRALEYYVAFAYWRWSCINEGILDRIRSGAKRRQQIDPQVVRAQIRWQAEEAANLLNGSKRVVDAEPAGHNGEVRWT
jgi:aminoglycoside phosphotransferase (APT) family kinase protein